ncbi:MAG: hypothetical protein RLZ98_3653 [Pseudomonadota bacterium]|jgi:hypothetical protein
MTTSKSHIEEMEARLEEVSAREQLLIRALDDALAAADRRLLDEFRSVAMEHEARRAVILTELQSLAARIGAFPVGEPAMEEITYEHLDENMDLPKGGDWRKAAERIADSDGFDSEAPSVEAQAQRRA